MVSYGYRNIYINGYHNGNYGRFKENVETKQPIRPTATHE